VPRASAAPTLEAAYAHQLRGDIDAIIAKATNREPADRYGSAQALAEDVARHLAGEAVLAKPQSRSYRAWKFVQRNRLAVGATAGVLLALGIGAVVSLWQAGVARQQAARAARVQEFVTSIFTQAVPKTGVGGTVTAFDLLGVAAQRIDSELDDDPAVAAELGVIIADSYDALGYVAETEPVLRKAVERAERSFGPNGAVTLDAQIVLISATMLNDPSGALERAQVLLPRVMRRFPENAARASRLLRFESFILAKLNRRDESYGAMQQALDISERYRGAMHEETIFILGLQSNTFQRFGDRALQLATATDAYRRATAAFGKQRPHNTLLAVERWYADALRDNDRPGDAIPLLRNVLADQQKLDSAVTVRVRNARMQLGGALFRTGDVVEAIALIDEAVRLEREQNPVDSDDRRAYAAIRASALALVQRVDEALALDDEVDRLALRLGNEVPAQTALRRMRQARMLVLRQTGEIAAALKILDRLHADRRYPARADQALGAHQWIPGRSGASATGPGARGRRRGIAAATGRGLESRESRQSGTWRGALLDGSVLEGCRPGSVG
jgi:serine/threonine-protein kinase